MWPGRRASGRLLECSTPQCPLILPWRPAESLEKVSLLDICCKEVPPNMRASLFDCKGLTRLQLLLALRHWLPILMGSCAMNAVQCMLRGTSADRTDFNTMSILSNMLGRCGTSVCCRALLTGFDCPAELLTNSGSPCVTISAQIAQSACKIERQGHV